MAGKSIHHFNRSPTSNKITHFLDKYRGYFTMYDKCTNKHVNLVRFYRECYQNYQRYHRSDINLVSKVNLKEEKELDIYLNNVDSCEYFYQRDIYRSKFITVLKLLKTKYPKIFLEIYDSPDFSIEERKTLELFLNKIEKQSIPEDKVIEWINYDGTKLARIIYIMLLQNRLPQEISKFLGHDNEIYGQFTSLDIQKDIELNLPNSKKMVYQIGNLKINLTVYSYSPNYTPSSNLIKRIAFLPIWLQSEEITITLWLSKKNKVLDFKRHQRYIGPKEINSGCTTFIGPNKVSIWRREEVGKVILHEVFHSLDLEQRHNLGEIEQWIYQHFDIRKNNQFTFFESMVESMADIINTFLFLIFSIQNTKNKTLRKRKISGRKSVQVKIGRRKRSGRKKSNSREILGSFFNLIQVESHWILFQAAKTLYYFRYSSWDEFYNRNGFPEDKKTQQYQQKSNVFSYIIVRSMIFFKLDRFLGLCQKFKGNHFLKCQIPNQEMVKFMKYVINQTSYPKMINKLLQLMKKLDEKRNVDEIIFTSMRMTCLELK